LDGGPVEIPQRLLTAASEALPAATSLYGRREVRGRKVRVPLQHRQRAPAAHLLHHEQVGRARSTAWGTNVAACRRCQTA
jgi:hypothetical protein